MSRTLSFFLACCFLALASRATVADAQAGEHLAAVPELVAVRTMEPILLDGRLDEAVWATAEAADGFLQQEPDELAPASEATEVRAVFDGTTLYFAVRAWDSEPEAIIARELQRDGRLFRDDAVAILIDTFHDHRNAYFFETNANGARTDGLLSNEGDDFNTDWDGVWRVASRIDERGWTAEFAIPFRTLRFDPSLDVWALQIRRFIRRKNEPTFFAPVALEDDFFKLSKAGHLSGLEGIEPGLALNIKPYVTAGFGETADSGSNDDSEFGLDIKWGLSRGLGLDLTLNTDFAETEVDEAQVNLTRFSLFFPEKREFFLENSGIFEFGTPGGGRGPLFRLFFSRRVGISEEGDPVPVNWGTRLAGKVEGWSLGLLQARTDSLTTEEEQIDATDWTVFRLKREVGARSSVGVMATRTSPDRSQDSGTYGVDWTIRPTNRLSIWGFAATSDGRNEETGQDLDGAILGSGAEWGNGIWDLEGSVVEIDDDFEPEAGFLRRSGVRRTSSELSYEPRPDSERIRNYRFELEYDSYERDDGTTESQEFQITFFGLTTESGDSISMFSQFKKEGLDEEFEIADGVFLPVGDYSFQDVGIFYRGDQGRPWSLRGFIVGGDYFDGDRRQFEATSTWRPSKFLRAETSWNHASIDLPAGAFDTHVVRQRLAASFSPDLSLSALVQYNDVDEELGLNLRLNWIYRPGADLFIVYNQSWSAPDGLNMLDALDRRLTVKFTYLFQR